MSVPGAALAGAPTFPTLISACGATGSAVATKAVVFSSFGAVGMIPRSGSSIGWTRAPATLVMIVPGGVPALMCTVIVNVAVAPAATLAAPQIMLSGLVA